MGMKKISVADIGDFKLGNAENGEKGTGCTVIICEEGAVGGVDVRGGGPATRETDLLRSENTVNAVNAVVLSGGSAFGLEAASGVMRELADRKIGFDVGDDIVVPIVCGASLYDLPVGDSKAFPDVGMGIQAVRNAYEGSFANGNHGAGTGATVGKLRGYGRAMKTGLGTFACGDGVIEVGAIAAVNAVGDIYNGAGNIIAGLRSEDGSYIFGTIKTLKGMVHDEIEIAEDSTSFVSRADVEEALAAVARQFKEERRAEKPAPIISAEEPAEEFTEEPAEMPAEELTEEPVEEPAEEITEELPEEPAFTEISEEYSSDDQGADAESGETPEEDGYEEFIPETPTISVTDVDNREYDEVSIPAVTAEPVSYEEPSAEAIVEEPAEEFTEEPVEEPEVEFTESPAEESAEEPVQEAAEEPFEEVIEEPAVLTREEMGYEIVFNTTISCLITNAALTKSQANKLASILHDAYARAIKPVHGTLDGDTVFVLATGKQQVNFDAFAALATDVMQYAIIDGAMSAEGAYGLPSAKDMK